MDKILELLKNNKAKVVATALAAAAYFGLSASPELAAEIAGWLNTLADALAAE